MAKGSRHVGRSASDGSFVIDRAYVRSEIREGARTFLAPLSGIYRAATAATGKSLAASTLTQGRRKPKK